MLSGLYGDLPEAKSNASTSGSGGSGWAAKPKFAPPARKSVLGAPRSLAGATKKRPREVVKGETVPLEGGSVLSAVSATSLLGNASTQDRLQDEYDPARPNEYEAVRRERERLKQEAQQEASRQEELQIAQEREVEAALSKPEISAEEREAALSLSGEEAFLRRARLSRQGGQSAEAALAEAGPSFAQRMMEKMGWKEGLGLGKAHQGITTPLVAQKTDHRSAVIVNAALPKGATEEGAPPAEKRAKGVVIQGTPSRVVLLRNIVGPGEVDDSLEDEIGEECSKYGQISQITIFEVTEPGYPAEQAVRIFVKFERMESAMKALIDLDGRFFGGRTVKAVFFSEEQFEQQQLAPVPGQPD